MQGAAELTRVPSYLYHMKITERVILNKCVHVATGTGYRFYCMRPFVFEISSSSSFYINMYRRSAEQASSVGVRRVSYLRWQS